MTTKVKAYFKLTKFRIVILILVCIVGGYFIGQPLEKKIEWLPLLWCLIGTFFLSTGSLALNQYQEREIDAKMPRTQDRPIPSGIFSARFALLLSLISVAIGLSVLFSSNVKVFYLGVATLVFYNLLYTLWWKQKLPFAAIPGAIPGAIPILMGYTASNNYIFTPGGLYMFFLVFFWQMPHFWSLATRYQEDYKKGGIPTLPVALGSQVTLLHIEIWCLAYVAIALIAPIFLEVGLIYLLVVVFLSIKLFWELFAYTRAPDEKKRWLRFFMWINFSLITLIAAAGIDLWSIYLLIPLLAR